MDTGQSRIDHFLNEAGKFVVSRRWPVVLAATLLMLVAGLGARHLEFSNNYRVFFSPDNPELLAFDDFQKTYTRTDNILFVLKPEQGDVFTPRVAEAVEQLTRDGWQIPYATRVDSLSNFQHSHADGDELIVGDLYRDGKDLSAQALADVRRIALDEPLLNGLLVAPDGGAAGVNVTLNFPEKSLAELPAAMNTAHAMARDIEQRFPGITVAITGLAALNNAFAASGQNDAMSLIPMMYLVLLVITALTLRSVGGTVATVVVIAWSTVTAMGLAGHLGITLDPIGMTAAVVILTLAVADSVHILVSMLDLMREGRSRIDAIRESLRINFLAVSVTSITTIVGFLALNFSDAPPFWYLGNITAMGIAAAWLFSLTLLPALLALMPIRVGVRSGQRADRVPLMVRLARLVTGNHRTVLAVTSALAVALVVLLPRIDLNDQWVQYFDHRLEFRNDADFAMEHLTGLYQIEYSLAHDETGGISEPVYLQRLDAFSDWLRSRPEVVHVYSYSDIIKRLNRNLHGDDDRWHKLPDDRNLAAQYLLLYELSLPYGLDLNDRVSVDKSATRVTATLKELSTVEVREFLDASREWLSLNTPDNIDATPTGATVMFSFISQRNIESMLTGNAVAVAGIALILMLALRSASLGTLSLIPNLVPILMTFGIWALLVGRVGMGAATVTATSLGIVVDNTVHFLTKYLRARREKNADRAAAIEYAFRMVGSAVAINALILTSGFLVLATSSFRVNTEMGLLTAMTIVVALVVDFLLLPALLMVGHKKEETRYAKVEATQTV